METIADRPVLVYDGDCGFCTRSVGWYERWVGRRATIAAYQLVDLDDLGLTAAACNEAVQWVAADGSTASGAAAVARAFEHGGRGWWLVGRAMRLPGVRVLAETVYRWVARHRHRLPGGTAACAIRPPSPPARSSDGDGSAR